MTMIEHLQNSLAPLETFVGYALGWADEFDATL